MNLQHYTAILIAVAAGVWVAWKISKPIIDELRKKKPPDGGCGGCGTSGACADTKQKEI